MMALSEPPAPAPSPSRLWPGLFLLAVIFAAYFPAVRAGYVWDDHPYLIENPDLDSFAGLGRIWFAPRPSTQYYPLVFTTFWIEQRLWGDAPMGYHVVNILLHAVSSLLLVRALSRAGLRAAWLAGFLFALHPVHVESVAWIAERKDALSGLFFMLALLAWQKLLVSDRTRDYLLALLVSALAILAKTALAPLPVVLLLLQWWKTGRLCLRDFLRMAPLFAVALALAAHHAWLESFNLGERSVESPDYAARIIVAGRALWFYLGKLVYPHPLVALYPKFRVDPSNALDWLWPACAVALPVALFFLRRRIGPGPFVAAAFFGLMLAPALGFLTGGIYRFTDVADHFQYLASIGPIVLFSEGAAALAARRSAFAWPARALAGALLLLFSGISFRQCGYYQDVRTLFGHNIRAAPSSWGPYYILARLTDKRRADPQPAADLFKKALELEPGAFEAASELAELYVFAGRPDLAVAPLESALALAPGIARLHNQLGFVFAQMGRFAEARAAFLRALEIDPSLTEANMNLGNALIQLRDFPAAEENLEKRLAAAPDDFEAWNFLGNARLASGRPAEAAEAYEKSLALRPDHLPARFGLGDSLAALGRLPEAIAAFEAIAAAEPSHAYTQLKLGALLAKSGDDAKAEPRLREALRLNSGMAEAAYELALLLGRRGDLKGKIEWLEKSVAAAPNARPAHLALAESYEAAGDLEASRRHREIADRLAPPR